MHEAYIVYPPAKISVQIECIAAYDNNVILGSRHGHLLMYSLQPHLTESKMDLQLLQYGKHFSKKPIMQIEVVPEYQLIFSLSDGVISVNDISRHNFPVVFVATKTKGATVFALDTKKSTSLTGEMQLVLRLCVAVKRKLQLYYWKNHALLEFGKDIELNDIPKTLSWNMNSICVGFKTEYVLYDISGDEAKKTDLFPTSSSKAIEPCISLIDQNVFAVAKDEYLITVDPLKYRTNEEENATGLVKPESSILETEKSNLFKTIAWGEPFQSLVWDEPFVLGLVTDAIEVRVFENGALIQKLPELQRARFMIRGKKGLLFASSVSQLWCIQSVDISKQRELLLKEKNFQLALQLTNISDESDDLKMEKINEIQTLYAHNLFFSKKFRESMKEFSKLPTDPCDVIRLFPDLLPQDNSKSVPSSLANMKLQTLDDKDLENGLLALIDYLTEIRYKLRQDLLNMSETKSVGINKAPLLSIIDTTLLKCYLQTNDSMVASLLRFNFCHLEESEKTLKKYEKYVELIILYQTKGKHEHALQLLQAQAEIPGSSLNGHERTIQYLQHLGAEQKHLIFDFAGWVLKKHPDDGLKIFIEDIPEVKNLPRAEVLDFLLKNHKSLVITYLEHIIHVWNESKALFHNILIQQYREKLTAYKNDTEVADNVQKQVLMETTRTKLLHFLNTSKDYHSEKVLVDFPYNDLFEERAIILGRLGKHEKVLAIFIQIIGDVDKAIEYCHKTYDANDPTKMDVYVSLIRTILTPPTAPPYSDAIIHPRCLVPDIETVLDILEKNAKKINPQAILQILPDSISLIRIRNFLEISLSHHLERKRKTQILKGLYYAENLQIQEQKMHYESKYLLITELSVCPVCKKKFSNQSAFVRLPDGNIVHFSCQDRN